MLVSSTNSIGIDLSFIILGTSFTYMRKSKGPKQHCGTPCNTLTQLAPISLCNTTLQYLPSRYLSA